MRFSVSLFTFLVIFPPSFWVSSSSPPPSCSLSRFPFLCVRACRAVFRFMLCIDKYSLSFTHHVVVLFMYLCIYSLLSFALHPHCPHDSRVGGASDHLLLCCTLVHGQQCTALAHAQCAQRLCVLFVFSARTGVVCSKLQSVLKHGAST